MGWAANHIEQLCRGRSVKFRPKDNSMAGRIVPKQLCTVDPVDPAALEVGDIVLCLVRGKEVFHLVLEINGDRFRIGPVQGPVDGWTTGEQIYGKCVKIED